jgi:hypothetical protein
MLSSHRGCVVVLSHVEKKNIWFVFKKLRH